MSNNILQLCARKKSFTLRICSKRKNQENRKEYMNTNERTTK